MKINTGQLFQQLKGPTLPTVIWVSGDEPLLVLEACDSIRSAARNKGISGRQVIDVDARFDGSELIAANQSMSLFGDRDCIELNIQAKFNDKGRKALLEYVETANPDNLLLIVSGRLDAAQGKAKWFNKVVDAGWWLPIWPIEQNQLKGWLQQRMQFAGLTADPDAISLLAERIDGNLLAAKQEIDKLTFVVENGLVTAEAILNSVSDSSRYTVFDLSSAFLQGDLTRALKVLNVLSGEGIEPPIVLWLLTRELRLVIELSESSNQGQPLGAAFKRLRIFDKLQGSYQQAIQRASMDHYQRCLIACVKIDATIKGQQKGDPWLLLSEVIVAIAKPELPAYYFS